MAAGLGPQMRPDSQSLGHLDVVRWVYIVEHAAAGQLHLERNKYDNQKQELRAQIPTHEPVYTHTHREKKSKSINVMTGK